jgi:hypothetical protein
LNNNTSTHELRVAGLYQAHAGRQRSHGRQGVTGLNGGADGIAAQVRADGYLSLAIVAIDLGRTAFDRELRNAGQWHETVPAWHSQGAYGVQIMAQLHRH